MSSCRLSFKVDIPIAFRNHCKLTLQVAPLTLQLHDLQPCHFEHSMATVWLLSFSLPSHDFCVMISSQCGYTAVANKWQLQNWSCLMIPLNDASGIAPCAWPLRCWSRALLAFQSDQSWPCQNNKEHLWTLSAPTMPTTSCMICNNIWRIAMLQELCESHTVGDTPALASKIIFSFSCTSGRSGKWSIKPF